MRLLAGIALLVATGCSLPVGDGPVGDGEEESFDERASVRASVVIHHTTTAPSRAAASPARVRSHVSARFLRVSGIEGSTAEAVVGLERDVAEAALGCRELEAASPAVPEDASSSIEMLDVGDVSVSSDDLTLPLAARAFPDVGEWVSGVVYTSRDESTPLPAEGSYLIETTGSAVVDGFALRLDAPALPDGVRLGGFAIDDAAPPVLEAGEPLAVTWDVPSDGNRVGDRIVLEWMSSPMDRRPIERRPAHRDGARGEGADLVAVQCVFADDGRATVPAVYTSLLAETASVGAEIEMVVRRHRRHDVRLPGVETAWVDFDFAVTARAIVE
ncbi:MAG: hypothetical protein KC731_41670 [Myxococcales bacterium]|nr:hypothetical protein [Myxococcales bacterium]